MVIAFDEAVAPRDRATISRHICAAVFSLTRFLEREHVHDCGLGTLRICVSVHPPLFGFLPDGFADPTSNKVTLWALPNNVPIVHEIAHLLFPAARHSLNEGVAVYLEEMACPEQRSFWAGVTFRDAYSLHLRNCSWVAQMDWASFLMDDRNYGDIRLSKSVFARALSACLVEELARGVGLRRVLTQSDSFGDSEIAGCLSRMRLASTGPALRGSRFDTYFQRKADIARRYEPFYQLGIPQTGNPCEDFQHTAERLGQARADKLWAIFMEDLRATEDAREVRSSRDRAIAPAVNPTPT